MFHFNYNSNYDPKNAARDCLFKIIPVIDHLTRKCKGVYTPDKYVAIDEELVLWKGRLGFKQYISNKRVRFRIKMFSLCKVTGYLGNRKGSRKDGKDTTETLEGQALVKEVEKNGVLVPRLMSGLYGNRYHLYVDNLYTSERLFKYLAENGTVVCGTAMGNSIKAPPSLKAELVHIIYIL